MRGIASGAEVPYEDILILNCRSEIGLTGGIVDGCSALAYKDPETGKQLLAQNWDWFKDQLDNVIVLDIQHLDGTHVITVTEAGIVGKVGFNGNCVGVTLNAIKTEGVEINYTMLPIHIALRYIVLEASTASEGINQLMRIGVASTAHFLVADSIAAYGIEVSPLGNGVIPSSDDGFILHTNHWISAPERVRDVGWLPDSYIRLERLQQLKSGVRTFEDVWGLLEDEEGGAGGICRKATGGDGPVDKMETLFGIVMDLEVGVAEMMHGRPSVNSPRLVLPKSGATGNVGNDVKRSAWR
jgi:isopenicillin-N N-acyltransferase like protein